MSRNSHSYGLQDGLPKQHLVYAFWVYKTNTELIQKALYEWERLRKAVDLRATDPINNRPTSIYSHRSVEDGKANQLVKVDHKLSDMLS